MSDPGDGQQHDGSHQGDGNGHQDDQRLQPGAELHGHDQVDQHDGGQADQERSP